jgi:hypothetical protein
MKQSALFQAVSLLQKFVDDEPCSFDHEGFCQTHCSEPDCSVAAARAFLAELEDESR